jgi:hypothetical protein
LTAVAPGKTGAPDTTGGDMKAAARTLPFGKVATAAGTPP